MFKDFKLIAGRPVYIQIKDYMKHLIIKGALQNGQKLPSTREMGVLLKVSRNSVIAAYEGLEDDGFIYAVKGQGNYVAPSAPGTMKVSSRMMDWKKQVRAQLGDLYVNHIAPLLDD